ncbi:MAG TPA: peptide ABC transporter substrate-binding protein [Candidatus Limnocylindria bacterium]|nr:peptide ABC transporter substrate-binding protein [Candidatus Limnocylindria bacterium]
MRTSQSRRAAGLLATLALTGGALLAGAAGPVAAADPVVLSVGTTQDLDASNPFNTELVVGYEAFALTYSLLVDFDKDTHAAPGFADTWERAADRVTFKIGDNRKWSDGEPATSEDACFSWGLALAAIADESYIGSGYLDPGVKDAGVTKIECPDANTFIAYTADPSDRIFQVYVPILPKHIWGELDYTKIAEETFDAPLVGTGPYTLAEWKTGQFARFVRNPNFWGKQGFADEVVLRFYADNTDTMVQALKNGELDYVHGVNADQFKQLQGDTATYTAVAGAANGWTQLAFNTYGTGTGKTIKGGGASTKALQDAAFRDALGYAVDKQVLVDRVLGGFGDLGDTVVPPVLTDYHVTPDTVRTFNIDLAKQKLDTAGYVLDSAGKRLDKEGKPINLRLYYPNTDDNYKKVAQFVQEWYGQLGIAVTHQSFDSDTLTALLLPPESGEDGALAKYDIELWGWSGSPDPNGLLYVFLCDQIGTSSDSNYCNKEYDDLYALESKQGGAERKATLSQMQNLIYDEAPYDVLYYDANLDVYRNDRFAGWQNMPSNGTPFFTYGTLNYTLLTDATAVPTPGPTVVATAGATAAPGATTTPTATQPPSTGGTSSGGNMTPVILLAAVAAIVLGGWWFMRRRKGPAVEEE